MTREEAINLLHGMRAENLNLFDLRTKERFDALGIAIKALVNEGTLIDRVLEITDASERMAKRIPQKRDEVEALSRGVTVACEYMRREILAMKEDKG